MSSASHHTPLRQKTDGEEIRRPFLLPWRMFLAFIAIFGLLIVVLEVSFVVSKRNQGLTTTSPQLYYIWTYGPGALFTAMASIWTSVDYTAKVTTPWIRPTMPNIKSRNPLLLDYVSMFSLLVPFKALQNRHYLVASTALLSQLFTVLILVSSSLIKLTPVDISGSAKVQTRFINDASRLPGVGLMPLYDTIGSFRYGLHYPDSVSDQFVYQTISTSSETVTQLQVTVEGFSTYLDCQDASITSLVLSQEENISTNQSLDLAKDMLITINSTIHHCFMSLSTNITTQSGAWNSSIDYSNFSRIFGRVLSGPCVKPSTESVDSNRLVFMFFELQFTKSDSSPSRFDWTMLRTTQTVCKPSYKISHINITRTPETQTLSLIQSSKTRTLEHISYWDFAQAMIDAYTSSTERTTDSALAVFQQELSSAFDFTTLDLCSTVILGFSNQLFTENSSMFNASLLSSSLEAYYRVHTLFSAKSAIMEPGAFNAPGYVNTRVNRLIVQDLACHFMSGICLLALLILVITLRLLPSNFSLDGDPGTILGLAVLARPIPKKISSES
jgi:hypothetical protein